MFPKNLKELQDLIIRIWRPSIDSLRRTKQDNIQFQDEGVDQGTSGGISTVNFTGSGVTATDSGSTLTVNITGGSGMLNGIASGTDTYTVTISGVTAYNDQDAYLIRFTNGNTTTCTLNINGLGAATLYRNNDGELISGDIWSGAEMLCIYNSTLLGFQCIGTSPNSLFAYVTNVNGSTITKGQVVYAFGGTGDRMTVKLANNTSDATSAKTVGVVLSSSIANNQKGIIIFQGLLDGLSILPTSTYSDGDSIYLGATAGAITNIKPYAPNHLVYVATVTTASNGSAGRMYVRIQNGYELDELHNVQAQSPNNKDTIYFDSSSGQWKTASVTTILGYTPVAENAAITGSTKTKITYDSKGLVTSGADATTADISDSTNKRYVTDAQLTVIGNTSGTNTGDQTTISGNAGTATTLQTSRKINTVSFNGSADINVDANKVIQSYLGGGCLVSDIQGFLISASGNPLNNQQIIFIAKPLLKNETLSGFKFRIQTSGVFVGNNNNKAGAYELNPATGLLTKRAESANDQTIWKQSTAILNTVSFVTPYAFTAGVIYFAFLYCRSSQTTAPSIIRASASSPDQYAGVRLDFPNSIKLYGSLSSQTDLPATVNMSSIAVSTNNFWCQGF